MAIINDRNASYPLVHDPKYYRDEMRCFVPSCKKYRRDNPYLSYLRVPQSLKEIWCEALERTCPKMPLYVCGEHINVDEDCYKVKSGMLRLKSTANLTIVRTYFDDTVMDNAGSEETIEMVPIASAEDVHGYPSHKRDAATQCKIDKRHKAVSAKPAVRSIGCTANIKEASGTRKLIQSPLQQSSSTTTSVK
ncbi:uncharacterized protein LOC125233581 [Leguminivora glycinivorella]|uniref:uncharacterized protein LOC125233581 n=1 Tax=Leguminivora glycinivorella TaxID=1035111 RepID=UPI00200D43DF|nr:uncharacterized protein LOC125233581 [Leguminivora glycinivorella]